MAKLKEPVGVVMRRPLETDEGSHFLFINRPSNGPFGQGGTAIFAVDGHNIDETTQSFPTPFGPIRFSKDVSFLMIPRPLCRPVSIKDLATINSKEKKAWDKAYKDVNPESVPETPVTAELDYRPGNYA